MSVDAAKQKLTFAKVAASGNTKPLPNARNGSQPPSVALPQPSKTKDLIKNERAPTGSEGGAVEHGIDMDKFTPRPSKSTPVQTGPPIVSSTGLQPPSESLKKDDGAPVSEENVTKIPSIRPEASTVSMDGKSTTSGTTFPLDEKESLRPDDSASVKAAEDDDGRGSTQPSSQIGSDTGARAFSEQLREISTMGPPSSRHPPLMARTHSANAPTSGMLYSPSPIAMPNNFNGVSPALAEETRAIAFPPDEKLLEALNSVRDRVWVLKLEQDITDFVKDPLQHSFDLPNCNSFYRMLAHKMADYYLLGHTMNESLSGVRLHKTPNCRIPMRLSEVTNPSTAASTPPPSLPQMKILRRNENGTKPGSREDTGDGDSGSDVGKGKFPATREEREARYEAARLRILGSAKPSEDAAAVASPAEHESKPSSVVEKRKPNKKQRSDSQDGFEARSAYSMYPQGHMGPAPQPQQNYGGQNENMPMSFGQQQMPYGMPSPYGNGFNGPMDQSNQQWMSPSYGQMPQQATTWNQGQYPGYDFSAHMQAMSFQPQNNMVPGYQSPMGQDMSGMPHYGSPGQSPSYPVYPGIQQGYPEQYSGPFPPQSFPTNQPYAYGMLPSKMQNGSKKQNLNHPLPGSYNRQYFNPQSQTFIPGQSGSPYGRPTFSGPISPAISHVSAVHPPPNLSRQHSSQSHNGHHYNPPPNNHHHQPLTHPNPHTLTHPLPQPVFAQPPSSQNGTRPKASPSPQSGPMEQKSTIAKFTNGASLPPKPPPPISDSARMPSYHQSTNTGAAAAAVGRQGSR